MNSNGSCVGTVDTGWVDNDGRKISTAHLFVIIFEVYTYTYSKIKYIFKECLQKNDINPEGQKVLEQKILKCFLVCGKHIDE